MKKQTTIITTICIGLFIVALAFIFKSTFSSVATNVEDEIQVKVNKVYEKAGMSHLNISFKNVTEKEIATDNFYIIIEDKENKKEYKRQIYSLEGLGPKEEKEINIQITEKLSKEIKISYQIGEEK